MAIESVDLYSNIIPIHAISRGCRPENCSTDQQAIAEIDRAQPIRLGNVWVMAATIASDLLAAQGMALGGPHVVTIDTGGTIEAIGPDHPEYGARLSAPGFVGAVSAATTIERLAGRMRQAALAS
ncbi:hypothetical protein ACFOLC_00875 [Lysobacter cavernae]|uniref:Carbohydrate kinase FGGY N-terminal domain-containing protein n=1 Tax=Lysobacter cavernae TaxID=1685901 RepID=A0ABV7RL27_9GAMM